MQLHQADRIDRLTAYQTYRAPKHHGDALVSPSWSEQVALLEQNRALASGWTLRAAGLDWHSYRCRARVELISQAIQYTSRYRDLGHARQSLVSLTKAYGESSQGVEKLPCVVMSGHQPTLFHPGVWFKNFALDQTARLTRVQHADAMAINLVIDNDVASAPSIRLPLLEGGVIRQEAIAFDSASGGVPYEQSRIHDRDLFDSFGQRVVDAISPLVCEPLVQQLWPHAQRAAQSCENSSCVIAHARHALEGELGLQTLELPLSHVCRSESFALFVLLIMQQAARFRQIYNDSLLEYREVHNIRSTAHPVPQLATDDEWIETPFWIYGDDQPQRRSAWVRTSPGGSFEISNRAGKSVQLTKPLDSLEAAEQLAILQSSHWKLRPKALVTTMYARMVLSDLFIHGIGGAKYDQLGDRIAAAFFGIEPLKMMVVSATLQLPVMQLAPKSRSAKQIRQRLRDVRFAPETFSDQVDFPTEWLDDKKSLLNTIPPKGERLQWHQRMLTVNQQLTSLLMGVREELEAELKAAIRAQSVTTLLRSREYSFCLFDRQRLMSAYRSMLPGGEAIAAQSGT